MLRKFLKSLGAQPEQSAVRSASYLESVLRRAADQPNWNFQAPNADPWVLLGEQVLRCELDDGLPPVLVEGNSREQYLRTYVTLLLDNDRLAPHLQLTGANVQKPRQLLASFFNGSATLQRDAQNVLKFIEEKYTTGRFGQARLLLQLFDTDEATRRSNERNLFYEEMILAFMSRREVPVDEAQRADFRRACMDGAASVDIGMQQIVRWLAAHANIRLNVLGIKPDERVMWSHVLAKAPHDLAFAFGSVVPVHKWRLATDFGSSALSAVEDHIDGLLLREYATRLTRVAYFITLAPGETGFENLLLRYIEWVGENFECVPTRILPELHKRTTIEEVGLSECLEDQFRTHLHTSRFGTGGFSPEAIREAFSVLQRKLAELDINTIPEGDYDLTGMVMDELVAFAHSDLSQSFRVHRLS